VQLLVGKRLLRQQAQAPLALPLVLAQTPPPTRLEPVLAQMMELGPVLVPLQARVQERQEAALWTCPAPSHICTPLLPPLHNAS